MKLPRLADAFKGAAWVIAGVASVLAFVVTFTANIEKFFGAQIEVQISALRLPEPRLDDTEVSNAKAIIRVVKSNWIPALDCRFVVMNKSFPYFRYTSDHEKFGSPEFIDFFRREKTFISDLFGQTDPTDRLANDPSQEWLFEMICLNYRSRPQAVQFQH